MIFLLPQAVLLSVPLWRRGIVRGPAMSPLVALLAADFVLTAPRRAHR